MTGRINEMIDIAEKSLMALEIAEPPLLIHKAKLRLCSFTAEFSKNHEEVDNIIQKYAKNWDLGRLVK
ncbi:MAG: hypothetical protein ACLSA2_07905 [Candidatus Gastranaerophilaceae bacterium]